MNNSFSIECSKCKEKITFTAKLENGKPIPNPEKPGKFKWNPPTDADGEIHRCGQKKYNYDRSCQHCHKNICVCKHTHCEKCNVVYGWFRDCTDELEQHILKGIHYE